VGRLNPVVAKQVERMISKGASMRYIARATGVTAKTVRKYAGPDYRAKGKKDKVFRADAGTHYTEALPPEQWEPARIFLSMIRRAREMGANPRIDLVLLRDAWLAEGERQWL